MREYLKDFVPISYNEFWERVNYYGLQSLLVIYLTTYFHQNYHHTYAIYSTFASLIFGFGVIGGYIADKYIGLIRSILLGALFLLIANVLLLTQTLENLYLGAALIVIGVGLLKPSNAIVLGRVFHGEVLRQAYTYFYIVGSAGSIVGPMLYGLGIQWHNYRLGFTVSVVGNLTLILSTLFVLPVRKKLPPVPLSFMGFLIVAGIIVASFALAYTLVAQIVPLQDAILAVLVVLGAYLVYIYRGVSKADKKHLLAFAFPVAGCVVFFALLLQLYAPLVIWLKNNVNETVWGWSVPATWFGTIEAIFVTVAPFFIGLVWKVLGKTGVPRSSDNRVLVGLLLTVVAFLIFAGAARLHNSHVILLFVFIASFIFSLGEISTFPVALQEVGEHAPVRFKSTLMGVLYFSLVFSGYLSGVIDGFAPTNVHSPQAFSVFFFGVAVVTLVVTLLLYWARRLL